MCASASPYEDAISQENEQQDFTQELQYLHDFLKDEFYQYSQLSIRRSPSSRTPGVTVKSETREYFFDVQWVINKDFELIQSVAKDVKEHIDRL